MFNRILTAVDGSESSVHALRQTFPLARAERSSIHVISVVPPYEGDLRLTGVRRHVTDMLTEPCKRALDEAQQVARVTGASIRTILENGEPHEKIVETAEALNCNLIVVGVRGRNPAEELLIGSMTERVIGYSDTDVLVVPLGKVLSTDNIFVATDGSEESNKAIRAAFGFQRAYGSRLDVLTVADVPSHLYGISAELVGELIDKARTKLEEIKKMAQDEKINAEFFLREGDPSNVIVDTARNRNSGMIIMGSHGRTGIKRLLMGAVTERVIGSAPCPVLVARA
jgi:nucleotide-binding universal stress UspA family protein